MDGDVNIFIDDISLDDFLIAHPIARADFLRKHVVQVTRLFNKRLQIFIKTILLANFENSLPVEFYSYRIEMQLRGMVHVHGCLWLKQWFKDDYKDGQMLADDKLPSLVDQFVTCSLPAEDDPMRQKVLELLLASTLNDTNLSDLLSRPSLSCGAVFTDQKSASSHFSRSLCKQRYAVFNQWFRQKTRKKLRTNEDTI